MNIALQKIIESIINGDVVLAEKKFKEYMYPKVASLLSESPNDTTHLPDPDVSVPTTITSIDQIEKIINKVHEQNIKRYQNIIARSEEINDGLSPVVDKLGRFHSPKDGYIDPETDRIFRGGAYLPYPEEYFMDPTTNELKFSGGRYTSRNGWRYTTKYKMTVEKANELKDLTEELTTKNNRTYDGYFAVETGKSWNENGVEICYAYIKAAYKPIMDAIAAFAQKNEHITDTSNFPQWKDGERRKITGKVISVKSYYSGYGTTWKMLIQSEDGNKVFGTVPSNLLGEVTAGQNIELTASVSMKESGFYYYARPSKASIK